MILSLLDPSFCIIKEMYCLIKMRYLQSKISFGQGHGIVDMH